MPVAKAASRYPSGHFASGGEVMSSPVIDAQTQNLRELKGLRVLVVEDVDALARMSTALLRREGCEVSVAKLGCTAISQAAEFRPQVVLLDVRLPDMTGL